MTNQLKPLIKRIISLDTTEPIYPWNKIAVFPVGGLRSIGFQSGSDLLLVVSDQGRGVIDCLIGQKVSRDQNEYYEDETQLEAEGIGPLSGQKIRISGLYGGGLPNSTSDGWSLEIASLTWPEQILILVEPGSWLYGGLYDKPDNFWKIYSDFEIRAQGFSSTGRTLVIATSSELIIYARNDIG
jgi:hypothetical protein